MNKLRHSVRQWIGRRAGSTVTEYAIIVSIISIVGVILLIKIGDSAKALLEQTNNNMP